MATEFIRILSMRPGAMDPALRLHWSELVSMSLLPLLCNIIANTSVPNLLIAQFFTLS